MFFKCTDYELKLKPTESMFFSPFSPKIHLSFDHSPMHVYQPCKYPQWEKNLMRIET